MQKTFEQWMQDVNEAIERHVGLSSDDLPDICYRDMYDDGESAHAAVRYANE